MERIMWELVNEVPRKLLRQKVRNAHACIVINNNPARNNN